MAETEQQVNAEATEAFGYTLDSLRADAVATVRTLSCAKLLNVSSKATPLKDSTISSIRRTTLTLKRVERLNFPQYIGGPNSSHHQHVPV
jgi:hypothetical protein